MRTRARNDLITMPPQQVLAQADLFLLLAELLRPPHRIQLPSPEETDELGAAAWQNHEDAPSTSRPSEVIAAFAETPSDCWSDEYHRLFEGPLICPINETAYIRRDKGAILADIAGFYRAFGFDCASNAAEKHDHLRCEFEFLAVLLVMLAQAMEQSHQEAQEVTHEAVCAFARDHLNDWVPMFCDRLAYVAALDAYRLLAAQIRHCWQSFARDFSLPKPSTPDSPPDEVVGLDQEWPMECGAGASDTACRLTIDGRAQG